MNEKPKMHLNDPPQKTLSDWLEHHPAATALPGKQAGGWTVQKHRVISLQKQLFLFLSGWSLQIARDWRERGRGAKRYCPETRQIWFWSHADFDQADKSCFKVDLSVCVPPGFVWRRVTSPPLSDTNVYVRRISFCPLIRFQTPPVACVIVVAAALLTSAALSFYRTFPQMYSTHFPLRKCGSVTGVWSVAASLSAC